MLVIKLVRHSFICIVYNLIFIRFIVWHIPDETL